MGCDVCHRRDHQDHIPDPHLTVGCMCESCKQDRLEQMMDAQVRRTRYDLALGKHDVRNKTD